MPSCRVYARYVKVNFPCLGSARPGAPLLQRPAPELYRDLCHEHDEAESRQREGGEVLELDVCPHPRWRIRSLQNENVEHKSK